MSRSGRVRRPIDPERGAAPHRRQPGPTEQDDRSGPGSPLLHLQRSGGNRAVQGLFVQREAVAHTPARNVLGVLRQDPQVAGFVPAGGGTPPVEIHRHTEFRAAYIAYAMRNRTPRREAEAEALFVHAFTDRDSGVIHLDRERGDPGTIVHEALHLRSSRSFIEQVHPRVNEGATEFFTRRVCGAGSIERGTGSYPDEHAAIVLLVARTSIDALARAYFLNDTSALEAALEAEKPGLWIDWLIAMTRGIAQANALLAGEATEAPEAADSPSPHEPVGGPGRPRSSARAEPAR